MERLGVPAMKGLEELFLNADWLTFVSGWMREYNILKQIDAHDDGNVYVCKDPEGEHCIVRSFFLRGDSDPKALDLHFVKNRRILLQKKHANVVSMSKAIYEPYNDTLYEIFPVPNSSIFFGITFLYKPEPLDIRAGLDMSTLKVCLYHALMGLSHYHDNGFYHGSISPATLMIDRQSKILKLTSFMAPRGFSTYKAPELLLSPEDGPSAKSDIWALGCTFVESIMQEPLFFGPEIKQIFSTFIGKDRKKWPKTRDLLLETAPKSFPSSLGKRLVQRILDDPEKGVDQRRSDAFEGVTLIAMMLQINPRLRCSAKELLAHAFFTDVKSLTMEDVGDDFFD